MRLKKMEISGFKSFSDKTVIDFPPGISAIVGPNGCGKSNVVDALRWAMGEQSVKQLRGKSMEDVIFGGTDGRLPLNMAEVTLTLANDNGTAPEELKEFTEIALTRRLFRSGESAYLINRQPCRLKDIISIFLGSGLGAKSYAIIQQGNIGAITEAGPEERRFFIEEAAGITRYKTRKTETLRKIKATNQNLLRVTDIISEVEKRMNSLKRQANKAERFKDFRNRLRDLDVRLSHHRYDALSQEIQKSAYLLKELKDEDIGCAANLRKLDAAIEEVRLRRARKNQEISDRKSDKFEIQRRIDRMENDLAHSRKEIRRLEGEFEDMAAMRTSLSEKNREIIGEIEQGKERVDGLTLELESVQTDLSREERTTADIRREHDELKQNLEAAKNRMMDLVAQEAKYKNISQNVSSNKENLERRLKRADESAVMAERRASELGKKETDAKETLEQCRNEIADISAEIEDTRNRLTEINRELGQKVKAVHTLEYDRGKVRSQYSAFKKMADNFEWFRDGVRAVMRREELRGGVLGLMADVLEPQPSYESAVEAVLGESLQYVIVREPEDGKSAIEFLQTDGAGRSGFIPLSLTSPIMRTASEETGDRLLNHVTVREGYAAVAETLLGHVFMAGDIREALTRVRENGRDKTFVTPNGDLVTREGIMAGGSPEKLSGILTKKQELKALEEKLREFDRALEQARLEQERLEDAVRDVETELQKAVTAKNEAAAEEMEYQKELYRVSEERKHARRESEILRLEQEQLLAESDDMDEEMEKYHAALKRISAEVAGSQGETAELTARMDARAEEMAEFDRQVVDLKLRKTALGAELENRRNSLRRLTAFQEDGVRRLDALEEDLTEKGRRKETAAEKIRRLETGISEMYESLNDLLADLEVEETDYAAIDAELKEKDRSVSQIKTRREDVLKKIRLLEVEQAQREMKRENIANRIAERYHRPLKAFRPELPKMAGGDLTPQQMEEELKSLRDRLQRMGEVNMGAIAEYREHKERFDFLMGQKEDLLKAIDDLHKVIQKINRISQERFMTTFDLINQKLDEVFRRLFNGGTARLVLTDPGNPLETGVEFMAHPPGKKLTRLSLLSGGEKALSAIAFVFSIFLIKPASFCIMDEIDAPLDEANVMRFNDLLQLIGENSQIIMITHKKKSMEFADTLFGVTMEQKGVSKVVSVSLQGAGTAGRNSSDLLRPSADGTAEGADGRPPE